MQPARRATVVGGGPAGLYAAEVLAGAGLEVTIFEFRASLGRKFLLAGRGGLNITHSEPFETLLSRYGPRTQVLEPALRFFPPQALREWCQELDEPTFVGSSGRVFPESFKATPLLRAWLRRLASQGVAVRTGHRWTGWASAQGDAPVTMTFEANGESVDVGSDVVVLALGGASWPRVSTDGSWVETLTGAGVGVEPLAAANCGVQTEWTDTLSERFAGEPLKNIAITVDGVSVRGDAMITRSGLEGGPVYAHSSALRSMVERAGQWTLNIDLQPDIQLDALFTRLSKARRDKDSAATWLRRAKLAPAAVAVLRDITANQLPPDPSAMAELMKAVPVTGPAMMPIDRAISSAGGVPFDDLDHHFMIKAHPGVFVAGEMLDWEAPTGGYLLQACFSSAAWAAHGALAYLDHQGR